MHVCSADHTGSLCKQRHNSCFKTGNALQEASTLLSALAAALSNCRLAWPAFLPVHDPLRDAHWGIGAAGLATVHYDSDSIHLSKNPTRLQQVNPCCALHRT